MTNLGVRYMFKDQINGIGDLVNSDLWRKGAGSSVEVDDALQHMSQCNTLCGYSQTILELTRYCQHS